MRSRRREPARELKWKLDPALRRGIDLFNARDFFECHEVLEQAWIHEAEPRKLFLQSIIHLAVAFHHLGRGNRTGGVRQLRRAVRKLQPYLPACEGVDTATILRDAHKAIAAARRSGTVEYFLIGSCEPPP